ncbi:hypothetical protein ACETK8_15690 [Brevundimonas staleyi]|uniref:Sce7726 family protein n=1 Tax=Brevundimonas staleyi TaxID=74326 RepID=A0ABW0FYU4_9CAUL
MASEAEARIRDKAEIFLRRHWPDARIVHEFEVGGARLDLAAITEDRLILVEIKSEKDTLSRLDNQVRRSDFIGGLTFVMIAERWIDQMPPLGYRTIGLVEDGDGFSQFIGRGRRFALTPHHLCPTKDRYNSRALMGLLLKPELYAMGKPHGAKTKHDVSELQHIVHENLTGREIRRGVMAALRARHFGWACDAPIKLAA